jgi:hypothetical protein
MKEDDLCLSLIRGLSILDFLDTGLGAAGSSSDSEALEEVDELVGERLGRVVWLYAVLIGSGNAAVACLCTEESLIVWMSRALQSRYVCEPQVFFQPGL